MELLQSLTIADELCLVDHCCRSWSWSRREESLRIPVNRKVERSTPHGCCDFIWLFRKPFSQLGTPPRDIQCLRAQTVGGLGQVSPPNTLPPIHTPHSYFLHYFLFSNAHHALERCHIAEWGFISLLYIFIYYIEYSLIMHTGASCVIEERRQERMK